VSLAFDHRGLLLELDGELCVCFTSGMTFFIGGFLGLISFFVANSVPKVRTLCTLALISLFMLLCCELIGIVVD
jgi:VIT1/CCC1 family predicted Fe2+/Mn2+ transporter